jgi:hypothetical protein
MAMWDINKLRIVVCIGLNRSMRMEDDCVNISRGGGTC